MKVCLIVGPTGSGKTDLAKKYLDTGRYSLINGDSMQVYREISIGNNKDFTSGELFNIRSVFESFDVTQYQALARAAIEKIHTNKKTPLIVGGSGLYIAAAVYNYTFDVTGPEFLDLPRERMQQELVSKGFDRTAVNDSDWNNPRRLQNYLKKIKSGVDTDSSGLQPIYELEIVSLQPDVTSLKEGLVKRVEEMISQGFIDEVRNLQELESSLETQVSSQVRTAAGYKQVFDYLDGKVTDEDLVERISTSHYHLAKKQLTWNRKYFSNRGTLEIL